ncbi:MAG: hypothetical protein HS115_19035 [Spirochaetales bacterium]|nr:hypothetical protein [Spirochaetales bacterium]
MARFLSRLLRATRQVRQRLVWVFASLRYLIRPPLFRKEKYHATFLIPHLELEIPARKGLYKHLSLHCEVRPIHLLSQELLLLWTLPAILRRWLHPLLEKQSRRLVSEALFFALNRNRLPPSIRVPDEPARGMIKRMLCLCLEFPESESLSPAVPAPFQSAGTEIHILIYKMDSIHLEILVPARIIMGGSTMQGFFQLEDLRLFQPAFYKTEGGSYRMRPEGIRLACVDRAGIFSATFRPDRPVAAHDRTGELLRGPSLLFRINKYFELEWYEQDLHVIWNQIQLADPVVDNGFSDFLRGRLLTDWEDMSAFLAPGARLERILQGRKALCEGDFQFPLAKGEPSFTSSYVRTRL